MDTNVEVIKEELELEEPSVMFKTENESEDISEHDMTLIDSSIEKNQSSSLHLTSLKKEPDDDNMYESDIDIEKSREEFRSSKEDEETVSEIKTEEIMLKSGSEGDDSKIGIHSECETDETSAHICNYCDCKANQKDNLQSHLMVEHDKGLIIKYGYSQCDYKNNFKSALINHMHKHDKNPIKYGCDHCEFKTHIKSYFRRHVLLHDKNGIKIYGCDHCEHKTYNQSSLKKHILVKHDKNAIKKYGCDHCEYKTHHKSDLKSHILVKHDKNAIKKYGCEHCEYTTHYKKCLNKHILVKHNKNAIKKYGCDHCEYKTHNKSYLKSHALIHDKNAIKKYACVHCDYKTHDNSHFKRHVLSMHDTSTIKKHKCD